jgi:hypothetical protein
MRAGIVSSQMAIYFDQVSQATRALASVGLFRGAKREVRWKWAQIFRARKKFGSNTGESIYFETPKQPALLEYKNATELVIGAENEICDNMHMACHD